MIARTIALKVTDAAMPRTQAVPLEDPQRLYSEFLAGAEQRRSPERWPRAGRILMGKSERVSRAAKRTGSQKVRRGSQLKAKASRSSRKAVRRVTVFKSTSWYQTAMQSIGIAPRVGT
jgi:hypothetical protein